MSKYHQKPGWGDQNRGLGLMLFCLSHSLRGMVVIKGRRPPVDAEADDSDTDSEDEGVSIHTESARVSRRKLSVCPLNS